VNQVVFRQAKLLIVIMGKDSGSRVLAASKRGGAKGGTKIAGRSLSKYFTTDDGKMNEAMAEALLFTVMYDEAESVVDEVRRASIEERQHINGMAIVIDAAAMVRPGSGMENAEGAPERAGSAYMSSGYFLITCIITHGKANAIMNVAREAGARGGTILSARGTGTKEDVQFFGISLVPEKEMLLIVADPGHVQAILEAVGRLPVFSRPGAGIMYTTPVEKFFILGT